MISLVKNHHFASLTEGFDLK